MSAEATTKPSTTTSSSSSSKSKKQQLWRKTRKKVGPSMSKDAVQTAEKDLADAILQEKTSVASASKLATDVEFPMYQWVPPAYRGVVDEIKSAKDVRRQRFEARQPTAMVRPRRIDRPTTDRYVLHTKDGVVDVPVLGLPEQAILAKQRIVERIMNAITALTKAVASYQTSLRGGDTTALDENQDESLVTPSNMSFQQQITSVVQSLHRDVTANSKQIHESAADFQSICQNLQQICSSACHLSALRKYNDHDGDIYIDLAEYTLLELVQINNDRLMLHAKKKDTNSEESETETTSVKYSSAVTGWFNQIVEGLTPSVLSSKSKSPLDETEESEAIDALTLQSMKRLLRNVVTIMTSTTNESVVPLVAHGRMTSDATGVGQIEEKLGQRITTLLEKTWSVGVQDDYATICVMEILARMGTLESARLCHDIHQRYTITQRHVSFSLVLEAYLEAIKRETDEEKVRDIVEEVMNIHNTVPWISHRAERIIHASTILQCLAVADMGKVDGYCASAELIVKRALREQPFITFVEEVESDHPTIDSQLVPIANYLAHLYATSGYPLLAKTSVKLLKYAIADCDAFSAMTVYPTRDTCNSVLQTLVQSINEKDDAAKQNDYAFARRVLVYMFSKTDMGCTPNQATYDLLFSLVEAINTSEIGTSAEDLLSYIEAANLLTVSSTFHLPYTTYFRVLRCYLQMAKNLSTTATIDEKNLPYRRAAHLLRKLEVRSMPMLLNNVVLGELLVDNLYLPKLRPYVSAYELVMRICANTSQLQYQDEAADVAFEIYRTRFQQNGKLTDVWDTVLEDCTNAKLVERVKQMNETKI
jgi:hypothetical protein